MFRYIANEFADFMTFLLERNIFQTGVAFVIAAQVNKFMLDIMNSLISPIVSKALDVNSKSKLENKTLRLFGIEFKIGILIMSIINFLVIMLLIFYIFKLSNSGKSIMQQFTGKIKGLFN
jgi:large conductance mechanosensitive channel